MSFVNQQWRAMIVMLVMSVSAAVGLRLWLHPTLHLTTAQLLPEAKSIEAYGLTIGDKKVNFDSLKGRWTLVFLGYTNCPDVCPLELQKLGQVLKYFDDAGVKKKPLVVFVSVDPERDNQEALKKYASYFHPDMIGITGTNSELAALANFFQAAYNRTTTINGKDYLIEAGADMPMGSGSHYLVNHTSRIFIVDPEARYIGSFAPPHDTVALISDVEQLLKQ